MTARPGGQRLFRPVSVGGYYRLTFRLFYGLAMLLAVYSNVATMPIIVISTILGIAALTRFTMHLNRRPVLRHTLYTVVPLAMCMVGFWNYFSHKDWFMSIAEALCGIVPLFVYQHTRPKGYWLSVLTMIILGLGALLLAERVESYGIFIAMLMVAVFNLNAAKLYFIARDKRELGEGLPPKYFYLLLRTFPAAVLVTAVIFVAFPRMRALAISFGSSKGGNQVGYTDSISLSGGGILNETSAVAFWVESESRDWLAVEGPNMLFRGHSMERFDGGRWASESTPQRSYRDFPDLRTQTAHADDTIAIKIYREPANTRNLFVPLALRSLILPLQLADSVNVDRNRNITHQRSDLGRYTYEMIISPLANVNNIESMTIRDVSEATADASDMEASSPFRNIDDDSRAALLQVPKKIRNEKWFRDWIAGVGPLEPSTTVIQIFQQLSRYFRTNFKVGLDNDFDPENALKDFLTVKKRGHCEYFVSGAVMYLRAAGIPARAVAGYRGGVFNAVTQLLEVQEQHAHAWVEFWIPEVGWVTYDPTPFMTLPANGGFMADMKHYISAVNFWFYRYVVDFNPETQREIAANVVSIDFRKLIDFKAFTFDESIKELTVLGVAMMIMIWLLVRVVRRRNDAQGLPKFYVSMLGRVRAYGYSRKAGESFRSFHQRLIKGGFSPAVIQSFDSALESVIYAGRTLQKTQVKELKRNLRQLRRTAAGGM